MGMGIPSYLVEPGLVGGRQGQLSGPVRADPAKLTLRKWTAPKASGYVDSVMLRL